MNGTVTPSVVVVVATAEAGGGLAGSYGENAPAEEPAAPTPVPPVPAGR
jgi:hypothetical protein